MNIFDKLLKSWWVILSFIMFINGFGFIYIGFKHNNRNWILEGIIYEIPWFFYFIFYSMYGFPNTGVYNPVTTVALFAELLLFVSIIRSFWVAIKLANLYDNTEKYALNPIELNNPRKPKGNNNTSSTPMCCLCLAVIFFVFAILAI